MTKEDAVNELQKIDLFYDSNIRMRHFQFKRCTQWIKKDFFNFQKDWFAISFAVVLSEYNICEIMRAEDSINTKTIKYYIESMLAKSNLNRVVRKCSFILVWDNASVNFNSEVVKFILNQK